MVSLFIVEQGFAHIVDWELFALFSSDEHSSDGTLGDCKVDEELFPILQLGEEWGRS